MKKLGPVVMMVLAFGGAGYLFYWGVRASGADVDSAGRGSEAATRASVGGEASKADGQGASRRGE